MRAIPGLNVIRPADANEVAEAWRATLETEPISPWRWCSPGRTSPVLDRASYASAEGAARGGYVLADPDGSAGGDPDRHGRRDRPARRRAPARSYARRACAAEWSASLLGALRAPGPGTTATRSRRPRSRPASRWRRPSTLGWDRFVGPRGARSGMHTFGSSAPLKDVQTKFGFTPDKVAETAKGGYLDDEAHPSSSTSWARASGSTTSPATMLDDGRSQRYIDELSVTGLDLEPDDLRQGDHAGATTTTSRSPRRCASRAWSAEEIVLRAGARATCSAPRTCSSRRPRRHRRHGRLRLARGLAAARRRHQVDDRRRPPTCTARPSATTSSSRSSAPAEGLPAIEESTFAGIPINVTLLFSSDQHLAAADAYMNGIERRIEAGLDPEVPSVASLFVSRWDVAVIDEVPDELRNTLGIAVGKRTLSRPSASCCDSDRWQAPRERGRPPAAAAVREHRHQGPGAPPTPSTSRRFAAPVTINTDAREDALNAFADHGHGRRSRCRRDGGDVEQVLKQPTATRASTPTSWPCASSTEGPRPSTSPGTSCSTRSSRVEALPLAATRG